MTAATSTRRVLSTSLPRGTRRLAMLAALAGGLLAAPALAQSWNVAADGAWSTAGNWNPSVAPNGASAVTLGLAVPYTATLDYSLALGAPLSITNANAVLGTNANLTLAFTGAAVTNSGRIVVNSAASGFTTTMRLDADQTFAGSGRITLNANGGNTDTARFLRGVADPLLTNALGHTIDGTGNFNDIRVTNNGTINANAAGLTLQFLGGRVITNNSLLTASSGVLQFNGSSVSQAPAAVTSATATGQVRIVNANVSGGSLATSGSGVIAVADGSFASFGISPPNAIQGPTNTGDVRILTNAALYLNNDFTNTGTITVNPPASGFTSSIFLSTDAAILGSGTVFLNANPGNVDTARFLRNALDPLLTIGANQTVRGSGQFNDLRVTNNGTVNADLPGQLIQFSSARAVTNNGTLAASNGGILQLSQTVLTCGPSGQFAIGTGSEVRLINTPTILSGTVNVLGSGLLAVQDGNAAVFGNPTLNGPLQIRTNAFLVTTAPFANNSIITVNPSASGFTSSIRLDADTTINGNGTIVLNANPGNIDTARFLRNTPDALLTIASGQTVRGSGQFNDLRVTNNGTIQADLDTRLVQFLGARAVTNNGILRAINGGILQLNQTQLTSGPSGQLAIGNGSEIRLVNTPFIASGPINITGSGILAVQDGNAAVFGNPTLNGPLQIRTNAFLVTTAPFTNNSTITLNPPASGFTSSIRLDADTTINGNGTIVLNANPGNIDTARFLRGIPDPLLTIGANQIVRGSGQFNDLRVTNNGTITADLPNQVLQLLGARAVTNTGTVQASLGGAVQLNQTVFSQSAGGVLRANDNSQVRFFGSTVLTGGTLATAGTGTLSVAGGNNAVFGSGAATGPTNTGNMRVEVNASLSLNNSFTNNGQITLNPDASGFTSTLFVNGDYTIGGLGSITLNANPGNIDTARIVRGTPDPLLTFGPQQTLRGQGQINDTRVAIQGTIDPGTAAAAGRINVFNRSITLAPTSTLNFDLFGTAAYDQLTSNVPVALTGTLRVRLAPGFSAPTGTNFDLITAPSITGAFAAVDLPPAPFPQGWVVTIEDTRVRVTLTCNPADIARSDGSPSPDGPVNNGDFQLFFASFFEGCTRAGVPCAFADIAQSDGTPGPDGEVNNGDFQLFFEWFFAPDC